MLKYISKRSLLLVLCDMLAIIAAFAAALMIRNGDLSWQYLYGFLSRYAIYPFVFLICFYIFDLYYPFKYFRKTNSFIEVLSSTLIGMVLSIAMAYMDKTLRLQRLVFLYAGIVLVPLIVLVRVLYDWLFASRFLDQRVLILGTSDLANQIVKVILSTPHSGMELIGVVSEKKEAVKGTIYGVPFLGGLTELPSLIKWYGIRLVILGFDTRSNIHEGEIVAKLFEQHVTVTSAVHLFEKLKGEVPFELVSEHYLLSIASQVRTHPYLKLKRILDLLASLLLLLVMSPALLAAIFVLMFSGFNKIFFVQERIGLNGNSFKLYKLRSMQEDRKGKPVTTRFGKWIRKYHIDEIPQLWNVIKGDMSLIGPRPEIPYFVQRCRKRIPFYDLVFSIKPGLTGWAQVNFRYTVTMKDYSRKFRYNLYYLKNMSLGIDFLIIVKTIRSVILGKGE